jgi:hypothetical protein
MCRETSPGGSLSVRPAGLEPTTLRRTPVLCQLSDGHHSATHATLLDHICPASSFAADSVLLLLLCMALFEQFIDGQQPFRSFVVLKVVHRCRDDRPRIGAWSGMIGRGADRRADPVDYRFQFRVGGQESHSDGPRPLLGHASRLRTMPSLD